MGDRRLIGILLLYYGNGKRRKERRKLEDSSEARELALPAEQ